MSKKPCKFMSRPLAKNEPTFTLVGRDPCASLVIALWAELRIDAGLNDRNDPQMLATIKSADSFIDFVKNDPEKMKKVARVLSVERMTLIRLACER